MGVGSRVRNLRPAADGFFVDLSFSDGDMHERVYLFNHRLELVRMDLTQGFVALHESLHADGRVTASLDEERNRLLRIERIVK